MSKPSNSDSVDQDDSSLEVEFLKLSRFKATLVSVCLAIATTLTPIHVQYPSSTKRRLEEEGKPRWQIETRFLRFHVPFRKSRGDVACPARVYIYWASQLYVILKLLLVSLVYINFSSILAHWQKLTRNEKSACFRLDDLDWTSRQQVLTINQNHQILTYIGSPISTINDLLPYSALILNLGVIILLSFSLLPVGRDLTWTSLSAYQRPMDERARFRQLFWQQLADILSNNVDVDDDDDNEEFELAKHDGISETKKLESRIDLFFERYQKYNTSNGTSGHRKIISLTRQEFGESYRWLRIVLRDEGLKQPAREPLAHKWMDEYQFKMHFSSHPESLWILPEQLSLKSYGKILNYTIYMSLYLASIGLIISTLIVREIYIKEIDRQVELRQAQLNCYSQANRTIGSDLLLLYEYPIIGKELTAKEIEIYSNPQSSRASLMLIEFRHAFPISVIIGYSEASIAFWLLSVWSGTMYAAIMMNFYSQRIWMRQIMGQLDSVSILIGQMYLIRQQDTPSKLTDSLLDATRISIEQQLATSYLNYRMFKAELPQYQSLMRYVMMQIFTLIIFGSLISIYFLYRPHNSYWSIIWIVGVLISMIINTNCYMSVGTSSMARKLMAKLDVIMAKANQNCMGCSYILGLWRRQFLTDSEIESIFGMRVMGINLTQSNLIQFNSYVFGGTLFLYKGTW